MSKYVFTSECVTMGHPDKLADQVSDSVLDAVLAQDPKGRVACECFVTTGLAIIGGEITTTATVDFIDLARKTIKDIGYVDATMGYDYKTCGVLVSVGKQSPDIAQGVDEKKDKEQGAGDQGMMFGFACKDTPELMPLPISLARKLANRLAQARQEKEIPFLWPDGKTQVTVEYDGYQPRKVTAVVVSTQHTADVSQEEVRETVIQKIIKHIIPAKLLSKDAVFHVNPTGRFVVGGPQGDTGLTGRKIIVDTYGGMGRHGGGAFSGKDPSKVDRSACYMARYIAKNIVAAGLSDRCEVQLAYIIGMAEPVSIKVDTFGLGKVEEEKLVKAVRKHFPLKPRAIIEHLQLCQPIYLDTARYGHFGRDPERFPWERTDKVEALQKLL